eukprot:Plantae.Rhodophyta-Rhodochaete_pulchella.ctg96.p1 GENE.Plantae.Rhodophyta-Rhodochaete_pulchella.ctg96~~Plantae.Rhodophyta-Rhodochaete_pulchella.ctg96.p1  ORF type:complete len:346 (+),score=43.58 Plantae.Rhodophyta-Rhodochaete_pulchella.ctg96:140-1039(+)
MSSLRPRSGVAQWLECLAPKSSCRLMMDHRKEERPMAIFLGGGMGSGKTTARGYIAKTQFWSERGDNFVCVEADHFKQIDPVFRALSAVTSSASRMVHSTSTRIAEELLLKAVQDRRDFIFDSSMSWSPFIEQTVAMIRDDQHQYKRGPGYHNGHELYWERTGNVTRTGLSYRIEMVGVTVNPEEAVMRGFTRLITTGRGVPVRAQLESHRSFSQNFLEYRELFDAVYLLDNNNEETADPLSKPPGVTEPQFVAGSRNGVLFPMERTGDFEVFDQRRWQAFLLKKELNARASCATELME